MGELLKIGAEMVILVPILQPKLAQIESSLIKM